MSILVDMSSLLSTESNKYIGDMPDTPDSLICLYATGGFDPELDLVSNRVERPTFQVKIRDTSYTAGLARCEVIKTTLSTIVNTTTNGHTYVEVRQMGDINPIGRDSKNRWEFTLNFKARLIK